MTRCNYHWPGESWANFVPSWHQTQLPLTTLARVTQPHSITGHTQHISWPFSQVQVRLSWFCMKGNSDWAFLKWSVISHSSVVTIDHPPPRAMSAIKTEKHNDYKHCPESHIKQHSENCCDESSWEELPGSGTSERTNNHEELTDLSEVSIIECTLRRSLML